MASRINLIPNPNYRKSGTKSYLHAMRKYRFHPTKDGPYFFTSAVQQTGRIFTAKAVGGRARVHQVMCKKLADGQVGKVPAEDIQDDTEYLAPVAIGTQPAQTLKLDFDSGSADLWVSCLFPFLPDLVALGLFYIVVFLPMQSRPNDKHSRVVIIGSGLSVRAIVEGYTTLLDCITSFFEASTFGKYG